MPTSADEIDKLAEQAAAMTSPPSNGSSSAVPMPPVSEPPPPDSAGDEVPQFVPVPSPVSSPRAKPAARKRGAANAAPRTSTISKKLPNAEFLKIQKIDHNGRGAYITRWTYKEVEQRNFDLELMTQQYLVPKHGEGEYLFIPVAGGKEGEPVSISVLSPVGAAGAGHPQAQMMNDLPGYYDQARKDAERRAERLEEKAERMEAELRSMATQKPQSIGEQLTEVFSVAEQLGLGQSEDPAMKMMIMQSVMGQRNEPSAATQQMQSVIDELRREIRELRSQPAAPMMPPLPPVPEPIDMGSMMTGIAQMMTTMITATKQEPMDIPTLVSLVKGDGADQNRFDRMLDRISASEQRTFEMLREDVRNRSGGSNSFTDSLDQMRGLLGFVKEASRKPEQETFWGFMNQLLNNMPATAGAVGDLMEKIRTEDTKQLPAPAADAPAQPQPPQKQELQLPADFPEHVKKIEDAGDDAERVGATMQALMYLGKHPQWRKYLTEVIAKAKSDKREEVMAFLADFLKGLQAKGLLSAQAVAETVGAFDRKFDTVLAFLKGNG